MQAVSAALADPKESDAPDRSRDKKDDAFSMLMAAVSSARATPPARSAADDPDAGSERKTGKGAGPHPAAAPAPAPPRPGIPPVATLPTVTAPAPPARAGSTAVPVAPPAASTSTSSLPPATALPASAAATPPSVRAPLPSASPPPPVSPAPSAAAAPASPGPAARVPAAGHTVTAPLPLAPAPSHAPVPAAPAPPSPAPLPDAPPPSSGWQPAPAWQPPGSGAAATLPTVSFNAAVAAGPVAAAAAPPLPGAPQVSPQALQQLGLQLQGALSGEATGPVVAPAASSGGDAAQTGSGDAATSGDARQDAPPPSELAASSAVAGPSALVRPEGAASLAAPTPTFTLQRLANDLPRALADAWDQRRPSDAPETAVELRMDPPSLGAVSVRLVEQNGVVHAHVTAAHPEVGHALHQELATLTRQLAQHGIALGSVTVGTGQNPSHSGQQPTPAEWEFNALGGPRPASGSDPPPRAAPSPVAASPVGRLNVRA